MVQWLSVFATLLEDLSSVPSLQPTVTSALGDSVPPDADLWALHAQVYIYQVYIYTNMPIYT